MTLYFDAFSGASGDMILGALLDISGAEDVLRKGLSMLGIEEEYHLHVEPSAKGGVKGMDVDVHLHHGHGSEDDHFDTEHHHHHGRHLAEILAILDKSGLPDAVREHAKSIFQRIGEAEAAVHDMPVDHVHFHEVGAVDALVDIVGACILMDHIAQERVLCSPINVGSGTVKCAHGVYPVPAPATARIVQHIPIYQEGKGEMLTPTGAAILAEFVQEFQPMPNMRVESIGYGYGKKDYGRLNCLRVVRGMEESSGDVTLVETNIDDMTGEQFGFVLEELQNISLDAWVQPIYMKKQRPAYMLCVLCEKNGLDAVCEIVFRHTTTLGLRITDAKRRVLPRESLLMQSSFGRVRYKMSEGRRKPEYEDVARIARERSMPFAEAYYRVFMEITEKE